MNGCGRWLLAASSAVLLLAGGCASVLAPRPDRTRFFVLTPISTGDPTGPTRPYRGARAGLALGIGPVTLPDYLDRPEVVTRVSANRLALSETDRWAEPLDTNFKRVLSQNLSTLLRTDRVVSYPWFHPLVVDYRVEVHVERFESNAAGDAELAARWTVYDGRSNKALYDGSSDITERAAGAKQSDSPAALSRAEAELSRQIASAIAQLRA